MNQKDKNIIVEALRSGKYRQGRYALATISPDKIINYCCLGIMCELFKDEEKLSSVKQSFNVIHYDGCDAYLPPKIQSRLNLDGVGTLPSGMTLTHLNDCGCTFKEIADIIEREL